MLVELGHLQLVVPSKTDNSTTAGFVNDTLKKKRSKAWNVRYLLIIRDQSVLDNFCIYWDKGSKNLY